MRKFQAIQSLKNLFRKNYAFLLYILVAGCMPTFTNEGPLPYTNKSNAAAREAFANFIGNWGMYDYTSLLDNVVETARKHNKVTYQEGIATFKIPNKVRINTNDGSHITKSCFKTFGNGEIRCGKMKEVVEKFLLKRLYFDLPGCRVKKDPRIFVVTAYMKFVGEVNRNLEDTKLTSVLIKNLKGAWKEFKDQLSAVGSDANGMAVIITPGGNPPAMRGGLRFCNLSHKNNAYVLNHQLQHFVHHLYNEIDRKINELHNSLQDTRK